MGISKCGSIHYLLKLQIILLLSVHGQKAWAQCRGCGESPSAKAESKELGRWTLKEWLETKERNRLMDMWLAMHSSVNSYEFFVAADGAMVKRQVDSGTPIEQNVQRYSLGAYASIVGLTGIYQRGDGDEQQYGALFNLRLLGNALQSTQLTLHYGSYVTEKMGGAGSFWRLPVMAASLAFYFTKNFGIEGHYWQFATTTQDNGDQVSGFRRELMVFIDYSFFRVRGIMYDETYELLNATPSIYTTSGVLAGCQIFF